MDRLPFVTPVYKRDLRPEDYYIGYLLHPYVSLYTGRGCRSRCTFCLWPQTVGGHRYRTRSVANVLEEAALVQRAVPADEGAVLRRRHVHRRPPAGRGDRPRARPARPHLVVQRQGERPQGDAEGAARQRAAAAAGRVRVGEPADSDQHQEGPAGRPGQAVRRRLPGPGDHRARHLHPRAARGDQGDHPGDDPVRPRGQPAHHPGLDRGALPGDRAAPSGDGERLAARRRRRRHARQRARGRSSRRCRTRICSTPRSWTRSTRSTGGSTSGPGSWRRCRPRCSSPAWRPGGCARAPSSFASSSRRAREA